MPSNLSSQVTEGIRVNVRSTYIKDESSPKHHYYVFAYQVEIINESAYRVQLLEREWHIVDGYGIKRVVKGEGVVGKKPHIAPGETYRYVSGSHFQSPIGKMSGHYVMQRQIDQAPLQIEIPPFLMIVPYLNNYLMSLSLALTYQGKLISQVEDPYAPQSILIQNPSTEHPEQAAISSVEMIGVATGASMISSMGEMAERNDMDMGAVVAKIDTLCLAPSQRLSALHISLGFTAHNLSDTDKSLLENAALSCPSVASLHPDILVNVKFAYT